MKSEAFSNSAFAQFNSGAHYMSLVVCGQGGISIAHDFVLCVSIFFC